MNKLTIYKDQTNYSKSVNIELIDHFCNHTTSVITVPESITKKDHEDFKIAVSVFVKKCIDMKAEIKGSSLNYIIRQLGKVQY